MEFIYIDTALLAVPNYAVDSATADELIERLSHFANIASLSIPLRLVISYNATALLWGSNCGPDLDNIASFIDLMELNHEFSPRDLFQQYLTIFDHAATADDVKSVEVQEVSSFQTSPALPPGLGPTFLLPETQRIFASVAAQKMLEDGWNVGSAIQGVCGRTYQTSAMANALSGSRSSELGNLPAKIDAKVNAFSHIRELVSRDSAERLWANAKTPEDLHFAITIGALSLLKMAGSAINICALRRFVIGPDFAQSLSACQCFGRGRFANTALALCQQIIAEVLY